MCGCESWTIKKAERWRIDAFELWCWRRLLRVPWTARSNQSILKESSPEYSLEGLMLKLKLQYFGHLMQRTDSFEKTLMLGKIEGGRRRGQQRMRWLEASLAQWTWVWVNSRSWWWTGRSGVLQSMRSQRVGHDWATELNWTPNLTASWTPHSKPHCPSREKGHSDSTVSSHTVHWVPQLRGAFKSHPHTNPPQNTASPASLCALQPHACLKGPEIPSSQRPPSSTVPYFPTQPCPMGPVTPRRLGHTGMMSREGLGSDA